MHSAEWSLQSLVLERATSWCWTVSELASGAADATADECVAMTTTYEDLKFIERVMEVTHCRDRRLVSELCAEAGYFDLDAVCSHVLAFMDGVRSSSSSTTSDGELTADAAPQCTASSVATAASATAAASSAKPKSRATRRQRKQEKKARAAQRHQANAILPSNSVITNATAATAAGGGGCHGRRGSCSDDDDVRPFVIGQQLKVLQI